MNTRTVQQVIEDVYSRVNGNYFALAVGGTDWTTYLNALNQSMAVWAHTPYVKWQSLFNAGYQLPDVVETGKLAYDFPDSQTDSLSLATTDYDSVYFVDGNGNIVDKYKMTDQPMFDGTSDGKICSVMGGKLYLQTVSPDIVGAHIRVPVYQYPAPYVNATDIVKIDSIPWLITYTSAVLCDANPVPFIARNAQKLYTMADTLMKDMKKRNTHRQHEVHAHYSKTFRTWDDVVTNGLTLKDL